VYSPQILDHFEHPRNSGALTDPDASVELENPACGDILKLSARVREGRIAEIRFLARGCVPSIACGSALTELVSGKTLAQAAALRREELIQCLGSLPEGSTHASHLALDGLSALLRHLQTNQCVPSGQ
jgi:nitrogen fixation NifU-like protein